MKVRPGIAAVLWMVPGAAIMLLLVLVANHFYQGGHPTEEMAFKARRTDLVSRMQLGLSSASEAEKSAVMAITDQDSKTFADQARAATLEVEKERQELGALLKTGGTEKERELFGRFSREFIEFQRIDYDLLPMATKNTNLKAYSLAFGPAADAVAEMNAALSRMAEANSESPEAKKIFLLAFKAENNALRIETLLAPHIAEESDEKMDKMEASMAKEDELVKSALNGLTAFPRLRDEGDIAKARASYDRFSKIRTEIIALSRENTNVRSLFISLNQKRKATVLCQDTLGALKQAVLEEPVKGIIYGPPAHPR